MPYDELVKRLREAPNDWPDADLHYEAADAIEELSKQHEAQRNNLIALLNDKPRWIPVEERLPEQNGEYLVVYTLKAIPPIPRVEICSFAKNLRNVNKYDLPKNKPGFYQSDSEYGYYEITGVSHWMPLPMPPESEET